jgi:hypothetical protein
MGDLMPLRGERAANQACGRFFNPNKNYSGHLSPRICGLTNATDVFAGKQFSVAGKRLQGEESDPSNSTGYQQLFHTLILSGWASG